MDSDNTDPMDLLNAALGGDVEAINELQRRGYSPAFIQFKHEKAELARRMQNANWSPTIMAKEIARIQQLAAGRTNQPKPGGPKKTQVSGKAKTGLPLIVQPVPPPVPPPFPPGPPPAPPPGPPGPPPAPPPVPPTAQPVPPPVPPPFPPGPPPVPPTAQPVPPPVPPSFPPGPPPVPPSFPPGPPPVPPPFPPGPPPVPPPGPPVPPNPGGGTGGTPTGVSQIAAILGITAGGPVGIALAVGKMVFQQLGKDAKRTLYGENPSDLLAFPRWFMPGGMFASAIAEAVDGLRHWNEHLHKSNIQYADFSGAMMQVKMEQYVRDIQFSRARGEARAESASKQAEAKHRLNEAVAPWMDLGAEIKNKASTWLSNAATAVVNTISLTAAALGVPIRPPADVNAHTGGIADVAGERGYGEWTRTYARPPRFDIPPGFPQPRRRP